MSYPPFKITSKMTKLIAQIAQTLGQVDAFFLESSAPSLRKKNTIKTIKSTLAIEGHTFNEDQITAILENRRVLGEKKEIIEVQNAIKIYESSDSLNPKSEKNFLKAHHILMKSLIPSSGKYRSKNVGILKGTEVKHLAPKPSFVPELMKKLFSWYEKEKDLHPLILSSIIHYEIEFIHPFEDGNGRMGRFWQTLILSRYHTFFKLTPTESLIERNQQKYYDILEKCDQSGESTLFIEFMLEIILTTLNETINELKPKNLTSKDRILRAKKEFKEQLFSRKDYLHLFKNISTATASRDLKEALNNKVIKSKGERNQVQYFFCEHE